MSEIRLLTSVLLMSICNYKLPQTHSNTDGQLRRASTKDPCPAMGIETSGVRFKTGSMIGENRQLVTNEPVEFEK